MTTIKVLVTGANGQLGQCLQDRFPAHWDILAVDSDRLDITDVDQVTACVAEFKPDIIMNAAAYTAVDKAETEQALCQRVNVEGARNLAQAAQLFSAKFIHISTDYVFDGTATQPYTENIPTNPQSVYGETKLAGEIAVTQVCPESVIIRTAWVFSEYGNNFVKTMLKLGKARDTFGVVSDQIGCPTYAGDLAQAMIDIVMKGQFVPGIYHFCGDIAVSWYEFAVCIFEKAAATGQYSATPVVKAITTADYPTPAQRPHYSVLDCHKIIQLGIAPSDWKQALHNIMEKIV